MIPCVARLWMRLSLPLLLLATAGASAQTYTVTDLGSLGPYDTFAFGINDASQVTGYSYLMTRSAGPVRHAFLWQNSQMQDLGAWIPDGYSWATDINEAGQVCGFAQTASTYHAFLYKDGSMQDLGWVGEARGISDFAQVVGYWLDSGGLVKASFWSQSTGFQDLTGLTGGTQGLAQDINDHAQVVGWAHGPLCGPFIGPRPTLWELRNGSWTATDLGTFGGACYGHANAINQSGQIVGDSGFVQTTAILWQKGPSGAWTLQNLGTLGGGTGAGQAINNRGQIVGDSQIANGVQHAFLWQCGAMIDLNSRIPTGTGWVLTSAQGINDLGEITGYGTLNGGSFYHSFLLKPSSTSCCGAVVAVPVEPVPDTPN